MSLCISCLMSFNLTKCLWVLAELIQNPFLLQIFSLIVWPSKLCHFDLHQKHPGDSLALFLRPFREPRYSHTWDGHAFVHSFLREENRQERRIKKCSLVVAFHDISIFEHLESLVWQWQPNCRSSWLHPLSHPPPQICKP